MEIKQSGADQEARILGNLLKEQRRNQERLTLLRAETRRIGEGLQAVSYALLGAYTPSIRRDERTLTIHPVAPILGGESSLNCDVFDLSMILALVEEMQRLEAKQAEVQQLLAEAGYR